MYGVAITNNSYNLNLFILYSIVGYLDREHEYSSR